jgi:hypothetical protein
MTKPFDPQVGKATQWVKGQPSPNPGGRPSKTPLTDAYRQVLERPYPGDKLGRSYAQMIAEAIGFEAGQGNLASARELADRAEGRPRQHVEMRGTNLDLSRLSEEQRLQLAKLLALADGSQPDESGGETSTKH